VIYLLAIMAAVFCETCPLLNYNSISGSPSWHHVYAVYHVYDKLHRQPSAVSS